MILPIRDIRWILLARFRQVPASRVRGQLDSLGLNPRERSLLECWSSDRESFVRITGEDSRRMLVPLLPGGAVLGEGGERTLDPEEVYSRYEDLGEI